jgi:DNA-binding CsgD family transcriptional regulator
MWVAKFYFKGDKIFFGEIAKKFNIILTGYPISSYERNKQLYINLIGTIKGEVKNKSQIVNYLKKSKYLINIEENNDFLNLLVKEDKKFKFFYSPFFIYLSPVLIDNRGFYHYHLGCWEKDELAKLLGFVERGYDYKLLSLKQEKVKNISILGLQPNLTKKQKRVFELAVERGYYEYPKKIELKELAKEAGISYSTFQQHLKYAERKINNFFVGKY